METSIKESKFGDIVLWNESNKKFIVVRNYYKLPNVLKTSSFEACCMSLGNGTFVSLNESIAYYNWFQAIELAKDYKGSAPIKPYLPNIDELASFYPFIKEFNNKIEKLQSLGIVCDEIKLSCYWSSTESSSSYAHYLYTCNGDVSTISKNHFLFLRPFVDF